MSALSDMILFRYREELWQEYTATALSMIGKLFAKEWPMPSFYELADFDKLNQKDLPSGEEIMSNLKRKLGGRK